jgi:3'-phosphoadenosine 5'-phosphosulfate sulfotransferase (PAPS reductase)/FAD synthetase
LDNVPAIVIAWSGGKDSSTVASIVLAAAARKVWKSGEAPEIIITHADTGVENPAMENLARSEMKRIATYADRNGLNVRIEIATPSLNATWAVRVIGGRALPVFAGKGHRDCSVDWKVKPQQRIYKKTAQGMPYKIRSGPRNHRGNPLCGICHPFYAHDRKR